MAPSLMLNFPTDSLGIPSGLLHALSIPPRHSTISRHTSTIPHHHHHPVEPSAHLFLQPLNPHTHLPPHPILSHTRPSTAANSRSTHSSPAHPSAPNGSNYRRPHPWPLRIHIAHRLGFPPCSARSRRLCRRRFAPTRGLWLL